MKKRITKIIDFKLVVASCIGAIIGSLSVGYANTILYAGNEVSYDNSVSGLNSVTVQGALDEMCTVADFSDRVSALEEHFKNSPTSNFNGNWINITSSDSSSRGIRVYDSSNNVRSYLYYNPSSDKVLLSANDSSGTTGEGTLNIRGNPVQINGSDYIYFTSYESESQTINAGAHVDIAISLPSGTIPSGKNVVYAFVMTTLNSAWVFTQITNFSNTQVRVGAYNTYTSALTGKIKVVLLYK